MNFMPKMIFTLLLLLLIIRISEAKLIYLMEIARHGAKYPSKNVTSLIDPPNLKGQLTGVGMRQQYLLGSYIYQDYIANQQLLAGKLNGRQVQLISSSYQRSIDSAYSQAYGLFPTTQSHTIPDGYPQSFLNPPFDLGNNLNKQSQTQNNALDKGFQPPPVLVDDSLVNYCPNYGVFYSQKLKQISKNLTIFQGQHSLQISKLILMFNVSVLQGTVPAMSDLYDNIMSSIYLGRDLPKQFNDYDLKSLRYISDYYRLLLESGNFGQTLSTPLLKFMIDRFNVLQQGTIQKKFTLFACHAENLIELQAILNLTSIDCLTQKWNNKTVSSLNCMDTPDFASNLIFQIHQNQQTFTFQVKVKYNGQYANLCEKKSTVCDLNEFITRLSKYIHNDYEKQCGVTNQVKLFKKIYQNSHQKQLLQKLF